MDACIKIENLEGNVFGFPYLFYTNNYSLFEFTILKLFWHEAKLNIAIEKNNYIYVIILFLFYKFVLITLYLKICKGFKLKSLNE